MKILTGILFAIGTFFALFAWMLIPTPIGIFMPEYEYETYDIVASLAGSLTAIVGYCVWIGWGYFTFKGKYLWVSKRVFWLLSLLNHSAWLIVLPYMRKESVWTYLGSTEMLLWKIWILGNIAIAVVCFLLPSNRRKEEAEQGGAGNGAPRHA